MVVDKLEGDAEILAVAREAFPDSWRIVSDLTADVVEQPLAMDAEGYIPFDDRPVTLNDAIIDRFCTRRIVLAK